MFNRFFKYGLFVPMLTAVAQDFKDEVIFNYQYYDDNNGTTVQQPLIRATKNVTKKTSVSVHGILDAISSASRKYYFPVKDPIPRTLLNPDAVTSASQKEIRQQAGASLTQKYKSATITMGVKTSGETDYHSTSVNLNLKWDFENSILNISYTHYADEYAPKSHIQSFIKDDNIRYKLAAPGIGKGGDKFVNAFNLGWIQTLTPRTIASASWQFINSEGYLGNPYRQVLVEDTVPAPKNANQGGTFYLESYPNKRVGNTFVLKVRQGFPSFYREGAAHLEYQYYFDNWGLTSHSGEARIYQTIFKNTFLMLGYRYYIQSAVLFYRDRYTLQNIHRASPEYISYRTVDAKLSNLTSHLIQGKVKFALRNFLKPTLESSMAFFPTSLFVTVERYLRSTRKEETIRLRRYEYYDAEGLKAWTLRGGIVFEY